MTLRSFFLEPLDVLFFRDGRPYERYQASQTAVKSLFPPHPPTVLGALRAGLARSLGWPGHGRWSGAIERVLGSGPEHLADLRLRGPVPACRAGDDVEPLWPLPAHVVGAASQDGVWSPLDLLAPAERATPSDLGPIRLPGPVSAPVASGAAPTSTPASTSDAPPRLSAPPPRWLDSVGLEHVLKGRVPAPATVVPPPWTHELRVGIHRHERTRTTSDRDYALYSPLMVRVHPGAGLLAELSGVPAEVPAPPPVLPLGGEARLAACELFAAPGVTPSARIRAPDCPRDQIRTTGRCAVIHLGPALFDPVPGPGDVLPGLPGARVVSACLRPLVGIGGWDGVADRPLGLVPHVAPGSVWFCQLDADRIDQILGHHDRHIGGRQAHGFGHIALGAWPEAARRQP
ncbi:type III-B CRISPR module-associated Cmr3 family protein [Haliangium sp.]|uniref:type III-B CRISPR module-associated Cmr3 family protein n=1 Tax=Haliangium sp. TaxID=2663208 RepID=UPI003D0EE53A